MESGQTLSSREREVCGLLLQGKSNKEIAAELGIKVRTAEFHLSNIYRRLGVACRTEAVLRLAEERQRRPGGAIGNAGGVRNRILVASGILAVAILGIFLLYNLAPNRAFDYHSDAEIAQAAMRSAASVFDRTEVKIDAAGPLHIGTVVLNQFLSGLRKAMEHSAVRVASYEILGIDFTEEVESHYRYTASVRVEPLDGKRFTEIFDGVFPYKEDGSAIVVSFRYAVLRRGSLYKLVQIDSQ